ncbi:MAG: hypothetical protein L0312_10095, partial [Acidobacteria bacterium]|nr:hypothetical protein [Acidobacteriota bacterium]
EGVAESLKSGDRRLVVLRKAGFVRAGLQPGRNNVPIVIPSLSSRSERGQARNLLFSVGRELFWLCLRIPEERRREPC